MIESHKEQQYIYILKEASPYILYRAQLNRYPESYF